VVDIYAADFKFWNGTLAEKYLKVKDYPDIARKSLKIMYDQVGDLILNEDGIAVKGLLIRHLIMPDHGDEVRSIMEFIVTKISDRTYVNLLNHYHPSGDVSRNSYPELNRKLNFDEYDTVLEIARNIGIKRIAQKRSIFSILDNSGK
jgi:putative pyruvate formate lyase activating enzyme